MPATVAPTDNRPVLIFAIIGWAVLVGWLAQLVVPPPQRDWGQAFVAGLVGSFVGGLLVSLLAGDGLAFKPSGLIGSFVGAVLVLLVWRVVSRRRRPSGTSSGARRR